MFSLTRVQKCFVCPEFDSAPHLIFTNFGMTSIRLFGKIIHLSLSVYSTYFSQFIISSSSLQSGRLCTVGIGCCFVGIRQLGRYLERVELYLHCNFAFLGVLKFVSFHLCPQHGYNQLADFYRTWYFGAFLIIVMTTLLYVNDTCAPNTVSIMNALSS